MSIITLYWLAIGGFALLIGLGLGIFYGGKDG